jgi:hypothetical protein
LGVLVGVEAAGDRDAAALHAEQESLGLGADVVRGTD